MIFAAQQADTARVFVIAELVGAIDKAQRIQ
jgi:hypothetical protein